jgi:hypothetical protein
MSPTAATTVVWSLTDILTDATADKLPELSVDWAAMVWFPTVAVQLAEYGEEFRLAICMPSTIMATLATPTSSVAEAEILTIDPDANAEPSPGEITEAIGAIVSAGAVLFIVMVTGVAVVWLPELSEAIALNR